MSISGKTLKAILELDGKDISSKNGFKLIFEKLIILYKKDELHEKFQDFENFESYRRASGTNIQQFLIEFDHCYHNLKQHKTAIAITHIDYEIKAKIKSIFLNKIQTPAPLNYELKIKAEPTFFTKEPTSEEDKEYENNDGESMYEPAEALYLQIRKRRPP